MRLAVIYLRINKRFNQQFHSNLSYHQSTLRFLNTYRQFKPTIPHDLVIVDCGVSHQDNLFDSVARYYHFYDGGGYDCGSYQNFALTTRHKYDLILALNTQTYFWMNGWLDRFAMAFQTHGPGVYGTCGSFENHPHIRTPAIAFAPEIMERYPHTVDSRERSGLFEFGPKNFSLLAMNWGYPVRILAVDSEYYLLDCDKIKNGFRNGDQSNILIRDRHTDVWANLDPANKESYSHIARTAHPAFPPERLRL